MLTTLHEHRQYPLILLLAPAGFGKSTLAADYARSVTSPAVWLALRPGDEDARRLFERIRDAFDAVYGPNSLPALGRGLASGADGSRLARVLLPDLLRLPSPFVLVLDDYHVAQSANEVQEAVDLLLRGLPQGAQVVIATREPPPLSIQSLVVAEQVLVLGPDDLRFTPEETTALRHQLGGDAANDGRAEGWVAGILLGGAPRQLGAADGSLVDGYVQREILARLSAASRRWLEALALLESITPEHAARLLGPGPWPARLAALADRCPFLVADAGGSYRLHALVREALTRTVRRGSPARARRLWTAVRTLAEESGDMATAVQACNEMGELEAAIRLVRRTVDDAIRAGRWTPALAAISLLPQSVRSRQPDLALAEAHVLVQSGRPAEARQVAEAVLELGGRTGSTSVQVRALVELANVARYTGDVEAAVDWLAAADHLLMSAGMADPDRRLVQGRLLGLRGVCAAVAGQIEDAREALESAARVMRQEGTSRELAVVEFNLGTLCVRCGDYRTARVALASASANWRILRDRGMLATAQLTLANLQLRTGDLNAAAASVARAIDAARLAGVLRTEAHGLTTLGALQRGYGRLEEAEATLDGAIRVAQDIGERELLVRTLTHRAEVAVLRGELDSARKTLARAHAEVQRLESRVERAAVSRALGRLLLAEQNRQAAIDAFEAALADGGDGWGPDEKLVALYWLGTAQLESGQVHLALGSMRRALELAQETDSRAVLAGPAAEDNRLLDLARQMGLETAAVAEIAHLAARRRSWSPAPAPDAPREPAVHIEMYLFGTFRVLVDGNVVSPGGKRDRACELLALLALHPEGLAALEIGDVLYPDLEPDRAQHNVRMAVYLLRRMLGNKAAIRHAALAYRLSPDLDVWVDTRVFDAALKRARAALGAAAQEPLQRALELYQGPLLADAGWVWIKPFRDRYAAAAAEAVQRLSARTPAAEPSRRHMGLRKLRLVGEARY